MDQVRDPIIDRLAADEAVRAIVHGVDARLLATDNRVAVTEEERIALDVSLGNIRRIQFDIERDRPATLVIVPDDPRYVPAVVAVPPERSTRRSGPLWPSSGR